MGKLADSSLFSSLGNRGGKGHKRSGSLFDGIFGGGRQAASEQGPVNGRAGPEQHGVSFVLDGSGDLDLSGPGPEFSARHQLHPPGLHRHEHQMSVPECVPVESPSCIPDCPAQKPVSLFCSLPESPRMLARASSMHDLPSAPSSRNLTISEEAEPEELGDAAPATPQGSRLPAPGVFLDTQELSRPQSGNGHALLQAGSRAALLTKSFRRAGLSELLPVSAEDLTDHRLKAALSDRERCVPTSGRQRLVKPEAIASPPPVSLFAASSSSCSC